MKQVCFRSTRASALVDCVARGECTPEDLAEETIRRTGASQDEYFPWVSFSESRLRERAKAASERLRSGGKPRPLEGLPVGVKDTFNTADFPTQMGSELWKNFTPGNDARVVYETQRAGALLAGKTVTAEFAVHALNETLNPHDPNRTPGTSSSGSAASIALGIVPVALGSQTAGSIVRPASFCGVYGFKPSFGTIARTGTLKTTDSLDTLGFFTACGEDLRLVFDEIRVRGRDYPFVYRFLDGRERDQADNYDPSRPRVAWVRSHTWNFAPDYARRSLEKWVGDCASTGCVVEELLLPAEFERAHKIHRDIYNFSLAYYFQQEANDIDKISPVMRALIEDGRSITSSEYRAALEVQETLCRTMDSLASKYDVIISLSTAGSAPARNVEEKPDPALLWTLLHLPAISVPVFRCPDGCPYGLQMTARRFNDYRLLDFLERMVPEGLLPVGPSKIIGASE